MFFVSKLIILQNKTTSKLTTHIFIINFKAFSNEFNLNTGYVLYLQQLRSLLIKRFWIFVRRWILGLVILLLPFVLEASLTSLISSQSTLINSITGRVSSAGSYTFDLTKYGSQNLPYFIGGPGNGSQLDSLIRSVYGSKSGIS